VSKMVEKDGYDLVAGWKQGKYEKKTVSGIYNWLGRKLFKIPVHDMNAMKAMKREVLKELPIFKGMHRFIPSILHFQGYRVIECKVRTRPRLYGKSKYGIWNRLVFFLDCLGVLWWKRRCIPKDRLKEGF